MKDFLKRYDMLIQLALIITAACALCLVVSLVRS